MYVEHRHLIRRRRLLWTLGQVGLVLLGIFVYFRIRGLTETSPGVAHEHAQDIVALEEALGIAWEDELQAMVTPVDSLETFANWIYIWGHWPVIIAISVVLPAPFGPSSARISPSSISRLTPLSASKPEA